MDFLAKLAALVPKPRVNLTRFHGVFAVTPDRAHIRFRSAVTPRRRRRPLVPLGKTETERRRAMSCRRPCAPRNQAHQGSLAACFFHQEIHLKRSLQSLRIARFLLPKPITQKNQRAPNPILSKQIGWSWSEQAGYGFLYPRDDAD